MFLTGGQSKMNFDAIGLDQQTNANALSEASLRSIEMLSIDIDDEDLKAHNARLDEIEKISGNKITWN
jgi:site-specific recombinase